MVQLVQTKPLIVVGLCLGDDLVVCVKKVLCETAEHVHHSESIIIQAKMGEEISCLLIRAVKKCSGGFDLLGFIMAVVA